MSDVTSRLTKCFSTVFPKLNSNEIATASGSSVADWDSLANITLLSVIEEEFGIDVDFEAFDDVPSFAILLDYLKAKLRNG